MNPYTSWPKATAVIAALTFAVAPLVAFAEDSVETSTGVSARAEVTTQNSERPTLKQRLGIEASTTARARLLATSTAKKDDRIEQARGHATKEIERRAENLAKLSDRVGAMKRISGDDKSALMATIQAQIDALSALKAKLEGEDDAASLKTDIQSITKSYRIYALVIPQSALIASADRVLSVATQMASFSAKLSTRIDAAAAAGTDVSMWKTKLVDYDTKIADARVQAQAAVTAVTALKPDNGDQTVFQANVAVMKDARSKVQAAQQDIVAARKIAESIARAIKGTKKIEGEVSATTTTP